MNPVMESLYTRKSVRVFEKTPIPAEVKRQILLAASHAPTAGNQQLYTMIDVTDQALKDRLAETCDHQPFIASGALVFCADAQKWYDAYASVGCEPRLPGSGDLLLAMQDAVIAAQNAVTAAWSLGVGSCYIGDILENCEEHRALLHLPAYVMPATLVVFGYPTQQQKERVKPARCELEYLVHENAYRRMGDAELKAMLGNHTGQQPWEVWCKAFCERKYNSGFSREMTRSAAEYLKAFGCGTAAAGEPKAK